MGLWKNPGSSSIGPLIEIAEEILRRYVKQFSVGLQTGDSSFAVFFTADDDISGFPQHRVYYVEPGNDILVAEQLKVLGAHLTGIVGVAYVSAGVHDVDEYTSTGDWTGYKARLPGMTASLQTPDRALTFFVPFAAYEDGVPTRRYNVEIIEDIKQPSGWEPTWNPGPPVKRKRRFQEPWELEPREVVAREALIPGAGYVEAGIAHVIERLNMLGLPPSQSSSGLAVDMEGKDPGDGYIAWFQSDLTEDQTAVLEHAADAAGLTFNLGSGMLYQPDVAVRTVDLNTDDQIQGAWERFLEAVEAQVTQPAAQGAIGGDPYSYAFLLVHNDPTNLHLVHGVLHPPDTEPYDHAWAEGDDRVYDWALAYEHPEGVDTAWYYSYYQPQKTGTYSTVQSFFKITESKQTGPWNR